MAVIEEVTPTQDRVVIWEQEASRATELGIILINPIEDDQRVGLVVRLGVGYSDKPFEVAQGDTVIYGKLAGTKFEWKGGTYHLMREADIFCILEEK